MNELRHAATVSGKTLTVFGIITFMLGVLAMLAPGVAGFSLVILLAVAVTAAGIMRLIWAFQAGSLAKGMWAFGLGAATLVCGLFLFANPLIGAHMLMMILVAYFILDGLFEVAAGFSTRGGAWLVFGGIMSVLLGVMMWAQYPLSGAWALGTLLGIKLVFGGLIMTNGGATVRALGEA